MFIPDPNFSILDLGSKRFLDPDPDFLPIPDPGVKKAPDPGSATLPFIMFWIKIWSLFFIRSSYTDPDGLHRIIKLKYSPSDILKGTKDVLFYFCRLGCPCRIAGIDGWTLSWCPGESGPVHSSTLPDPHISTGKSGLNAVFLIRILIMLLDPDWDLGEPHILPLILTNNCPFLTVTNSFSIWAVSRSACVSLVLLLWCSRSSVSFVQSLMVWLLFLCLYSLVQLLMVCLLVTCLWCSR